jgi:2'-5' RNA ligase
MDRGYRYAVYYAPAPDGALWQLGSGLLGYDSANGLDMPQIVPRGWSFDAWYALTGDPRRYGFHATLKAPFRPVEGVEEADLRATLAATAATRTPFEMTLMVARLGSFVALVPAPAPPALGDLVTACVEAFETYRAPLTAEEIARRNPARLTVRQRSYLDRYGYPYVREEFRFHMTLTGSLAEGAEDPSEPLREVLAPVVGRPVAIDGLALYRQDTPSSRFRIIASARLEGTRTS